MRGAVRGLILLSAIAAASSLRASFSAAASVRHSRRCRSVKCLVEDDGLPNDDVAPEDDGGLMAEFNARIDAEGGKTNFLIKSQVNEAKKGAQETAQKVQYAGEDAVDAVGGLFGKLNPQQQNIAKIVAGLIAFQILIGTISSAFR